MSAPEQNSMPEHLSTTPESIFPLDPEMIERRVQLFQASSNEILGLITEARGRHGRADDLYLNLDKNDLIFWHELHGRLYTDDGALLYQVGLLYGIDLAKNAHTLHNPAEDELKADNPEAFERAINYLKTTPDNIENKVGKWSWEKRRELYHTGSDLLSLANATLKDSIVEKLGGKNSVVALYDSTAMYTGMIDGAILVDAYHAYHQGREPAVYKEPISYAPEYNPDRHIDLDPGVRMILEPGGTAFPLITQMFTHWTEFQETTMRHPPVARGRGMIAYGHDRFVQDNEDLFYELFEIKEIGHKKFWPRALGATAIGATADIIAITHTEDVKFPIATALLLSAASLVHAWQRRGAKKEAERIGVPFIGAKRPTSKPTR